MTVPVRVAGLGGLPGMTDTVPPTAAVLNITVTNPTNASFLTIYPYGASRPTTSDINFAPGQTVANLVVVKLAGPGNVYVYNAYGYADLIVDVVGWYG
jgi:hypothetical protein